MGIRTALRQLIDLLEEHYKLLSEDATELPSTPLAQRLRCGSIFMLRSS